MQSADNAFYLRRSFEKKYDVYGCPFLDYRCSADFTDAVSLVYGHEAKNGTMFGSLTGYKKQAYYDDHKVMYLITPEKTYLVKIFAGCIVRTDSDYFKLPAEEEQRAEHVRNAMENSTFRSDLKAEDVGNVLILSTCTYEFSNARYLIFGSLEELH